MIETTMAESEKSASVATIDVLIPAYNAEKTIREAVGSITAQTVRDIRLHVVDDGSTDGTAAVLADMAQADPRIVVHTQPNGGIVDALNAGLAKCTAEFIARHDADDLAYPDRFAVQLAYLREHADVAAVGAAARHIDSNGTPTGSIATLESPDLADPYFWPAREPYLIHPFLMVRRSAIEAVGGYRHAHHAEDSDLYWRLRERGRLHNLEEVLGDYRLHDESISGGSIVNGRIMAIGSQLAALSARRRQEGRVDLEMSKGSLAEFKQARTLSSMLALAERSVEPAERNDFEGAVAAKLVDVTNYRPYELEADDCAFIRRVADRGFGHLPPEVRRLQVRRLTGAAARLATNGRVRDAVRMVPPKHWPLFAARCAFRSRLFSGSRARMQQREGTLFK